ncbi:hypothetical protein FQN50_000872 [Emmonsiellopsis sp. PD_5]|nr:hypothetical protein FQN50_000872 [Emmonsiellopsis sp. PD_5]
MSPSICDSLVAYRKNNTALQLSKPSEQWKLSLQEVKLLYLRRQYKQCAAQSTKLLRKIDDQLHAIHKAFLYYYSAISYEALGRGAHNYSSNKLPLLNLARDNFIACKASLAAALAPAPPVEKRQPRHQRSQNNINRSHPHEHAELTDKRKTYPTTTSTAKRRRDTPILIENTANHAAYTLKAPAPAQQHNTPTPTAPRQENGQTQKPKLMPSPLRIRKVYNDQGQSMFAYDPPSLPPTRPLPQLPSEGPQRPLPALPKLFPPSNPPHPEEAVLQKPPIPPPFFRHSILAFSPFPATGGPGNNNTNLPTTLHPLLTSLSTQLEANITTIATLIAKAHEIQRAHNASKKNYRLASFWSFTPHYTANDNDNDNVDEYNYYSSQNNLIDNLATTTTTTNYDTHNNNNDNHHNKPTPSNPYPSTSEESRPQRIARLKADGWRGVGIKSRERGWKGAEHYERVCNEALAELYGKVEMGLIG